MKNGKMPVLPWLLTAVLVWFSHGMAAPAVGLQANNNPNHLSRVAPEECWLYSAWSNQSKPDVNSANHTDRLLAEPEVAAFVEDLVNRVSRIMPLAFASASESQQQLVADISPAIAEALFKKSGCLFVEKVTLRDPESPPEIEGVLMLEIGDQASKVAESLARLSAGDDGTLSTVPMVGDKFYSVIVDGDSGTEVVLGSAQGYLIAGMGKESIARALKRMAGESTPKWLSELQSRHQMQRRSTLGYVNFDAIRRTLLPMGGPEASQLVAALGLANVQSLESSSGYSETEMVNRVLLRVDGKPSGLLALSGDQAIQPGELKHIPADSLFAVAMSLDPVKVLDFAQSLMLQFSPGEAADMSEGMNQFRQETGVDLRNDIIGQLGSTWCLYNGASDGWFTGMVLTASVKDQNRLSEAIWKLVQAVVAESGGSPYAPRFSRQLVGDAEVYSMHIPDMPLPFEPSWCISGNRLIITMFPQSIVPIVKPMEYSALLDSDVLAGPGNPLAGDVAGSKLLGFGYQDSQKQFELLYPYVQMMVGMTRMFMTEMADMPPDAAAMMESVVGGINLPPARSIHRHLVPTVSVTRQTADGFLLETRQTIPMVDVTFAVPVAIGLLLPAVQQVRGAARRAQSQNNLKQMALAAHNYESAFMRFPGGFSAAREGQPPVSWRVMILPYIEQQNIYDQYNFDEPWDSEHNLQFLEMMPEVFRSPTSVAGPGLTVYRGIGGDSGLMGTERGTASRGRRFGDITDGSSNTILFVETSDALAVPWTQPDEGIDPDNLDMGALFGMYPGGTNFSLADGSVQFLPESIAVEIMQRLMKMDDGQLIPWEALDR